MRQGAILIMSIISCKLIIIILVVNSGIAKPQKIFIAQKFAKTAVLDTSWENFAENAKTKFHTQQLPGSIRQEQSRLHVKCKVSRLILTPN